MRNNLSLFRLLLWLILILFIGAYYPPTFRFGVLKFAEFSARKRGLNLKIEKVRGSLFEPIIFSNITLSTASVADSEIDLRIAKTEIKFSIINFFFHHGTGCIRQLLIDGVDGEIVLPGEMSKGVESGPTQPISRRLLPVSIQAKRINLALHEKGKLIFLQNIECNASEVNSGMISIEKIHIEEPWLTKTFSDVRGTMALQNSKITIADMVLEKGMRIESASASLAELVKRKLKMTFTLLAFHGKIQGELNGFNRENQHLNFQTTGSFSHIAIPELARFLESTEITGGIIQDGMFSFYGSLSDLKQSKFSTRLSAQDFRWGNRQWNSLVLGAMMVDRDLQILNLELKQAHNTLNLNGKIALPDFTENWLKTNFNFDINAKIDNVTELSQLFGPNFAHTSGKASLNGSIRGQALSFTGDLSVSGSNLTYQTVPIDRLNASIHLNGNELQINSVELVHQKDFLRGKGGATLFHDEKYWGEINTSIDDLALYSTLLKPPIVPQLYGGGLTIEWSGDGTTKTHSGAFKAQLKHIHPLIDPSSTAIPLNANLEGSYSPENIFFKKFILSNPTASLSAVLAANPESISLDALQLKQGNTVCLEGNAKFPFNLWQAWQHYDSTCWITTGECKLDLTTKKLDLHEALKLSGFEFPLKGELEGKLKTSGSLAKLTADGRISLSKSNLSPVSGVVLSEITAGITGEKIVVEKSEGHFNTTYFTGKGEVDLQNFHYPVLDLAIHSKAVSLEQSAIQKVKADLDININGPLSAAIVTGSVDIIEAALPKVSYFFETSTFSKTREFNFNPQFNFTQTPYKNWQFNLLCTAHVPLKFEAKTGTVRPNLRIQGGDHYFTTTGSLCFESLTFESPIGAIDLDEVTLFLRKDQPNNPLLCGRFTAEFLNREITGYTFGSLMNPQLFLFSYPPVPEWVTDRLLLFESKELFTRDLFEEIPFEIQSSIDDQLGLDEVQRVRWDEDFSFVPLPIVTESENTNTP